MWGTCATTHVLRGQRATSGSHSPYSMDTLGTEPRPSGLKANAPRAVSHLNCPKLTFSLLFFKPRCLLYSEL